MAVYTDVAFDEADSLIRSLGLGTLQTLTGIQGGIENTNYFMTVSRDGEVHDYVLTLFERLSAAQLPFYLRLMKHLAGHGIPVPDPAGDADGRLLFSLHGKPTAVVNRLPGDSELAPTERHCALMGELLARMHLAGLDFDMQQPNLRGLAWWNETVPVVLPFLNPSQASLIQGEISFQNHVGASAAYRALPLGPVHADLFRDNAMFSGSGAGLRLTGVFDWYFAGVDRWLFDLAVCLNDWCIDLASGQHDAGRAQALLSAYQSVRPLNGPERQLFNAMLRAAALRFWTSRLWDLHLPRAASMLKAHDPTHFERVLRQRIEQPVTL